MIIFLRSEAVDQRSKIMKNIFSAQVIPLTCSRRAKHKKTGTFSLQNEKDSKVTFSIDWPPQGYGSTSDPQTSATDSPSHLLYACQLWEKRFWNLCRASSGPGTLLQRTPLIRASSLLLAQGARPCKLYILYTLLTREHSSPSLRFTKENHVWRWG